MRRGTLSVILLAAVAACAPPFPDRAADLTLAGHPTLCPDFRGLDLPLPYALDAPPPRNAATTPLGCATARSLRVMVADPRDLEGGVTGPARSVTAGAGVDRYGADARKPLRPLSTVEPLR